MIDIILAFHFKLAVFHLQQRPVRRRHRIYPLQTDKSVVTSWVVSYLLLVVPQYTRRPARQSLTPEIAAIGPAAGGGGGGGGGGPLPAVLAAAPVTDDGRRAVWAG